MSDVADEIDAADEVARGFDLHDASLSTDPCGRYEELRLGCPVRWSDVHDGYWFLLDYETVSTAARDDGVFLSGKGVTIPPAPTRLVLPLESDQPLTSKYRRLLQGRFSPAAVEEMEDDIRAATHRLVDGFIERGECDVMDELASPLSAATILEFIGLSEEMAKEFVECVHTIVHSATSDPERALTAALTMYEVISSEMAARREGKQHDDALGILMGAEIDGAPLDDDTIVDYVTLLIMGGLDTSAAALGNALVRIAAEPSLRRRLLQDPEVIPAAVEEFLRIDSPVQGLGRVVADDVELCGRNLAAGDHVLLLWAAANRDPKVFPSPDVVDFDRPDKRHLSFGVGLHRCLGSNLGRSMFRIMLETVLERLPDFELLDDPDDHRFADVGAVFALRQLRVRFTPGARSAS